MTTTNKIGYKIANILDSVLTLKGADLGKIEIAPNGEFLDCQSDERAVSIANHIKDHCETRGFSVGVLSSYVMLIPYIHKTIKQPDFERFVFPDFKREIAESIFGIRSDDVVESKVKEVNKLKRTKHKRSFFKIIVVSLGLFGAVAGFLINSQRA